MSVKVNGRALRSRGVTYFATPIVCCALTTLITVVVVQLDTMGDLYATVYSVNICFIGQHLSFIHIKNATKYKNYNLYFVVLFLL